MRALSVRQGPEREAGPGSSTWPYLCLQYHRTFHVSVLSSAGSAATEHLKCGSAAKKRIFFFLFETLNGLKCENPV